MRSVCKVPSSGCDWGWFTIVSVALRSSTLPRKPTLCLSNLLQTLAEFFTVAYLSCIFTFPQISKIFCLVSPCRCLSFLSSQFSWLLCDLRSLMGLKKSYEFENDPASLRCCKSKTDILSSFLHAVWNCVFLSSGCSSDPAMPTLYIEVFAQLDWDKCQPHLGVKTRMRGENQLIQY